MSDLTAAEHGLLRILLRKQRRSQEYPKMFGMSDEDKKQLLYLLTKYYEGKENDE